MPKTSWHSIASATMPRLFQITRDFWPYTANKVLKLPLELPAMSAIQLITWMVKNLSVWVSISQYPQPRLYLSIPH